MKVRKQSFSFLMELIIVIFFFALATTICISFLIKSKEKQMEAILIQNEMQEIQSMIETMQAYPQTPIEELFQVNKKDENTYQKENIQIMIYQDQTKHGKVILSHEKHVICEIPFVLGGAEHE